MKMVSDFILPSLLLTFASIKSFFALISFLQCQLIEERLIGTKHAIFISLLFSSLSAPMHPSPFAHWREYHEFNFFCKKKTENEQHKVCVWEGGENYILL